MTLLFASAASFVPRFIECWGETNYIVNEYMKKSNSPDEQAQQIAWTEAINSIKRHGVWHSGLLTIKIFGDVMLLSTTVKIIYEWLYELFLFLRQVCSTPKKELIKQSSTIHDRVMAFYQGMMKMNKPIEATTDIISGPVATAGGTIATECIGGRLSPTNLLKYFWKFLNNSYSNVVRWLLPLRAHFNFEVTKYQIQICGCISYYFELLDKFWNFSLK